MHNTITPVRVLLVGLKEQDLSSIAPLIAGCEILQLPANTRVLINSADSLQAIPSLIVCGQPEKQTSYDEMAQLLRMLYQEQDLFFLCHERELFDRQRTIKCGATDIFLFPLDAGTFSRAISESVAKAARGDRRSYAPVKLLDIQAGTVLPFDTFIYLPLNNHYLQFSAAGDPIDEQNVQRLGQHEIGTIYVQSKDLQSFYSHTQSRLSHLGPGVTERKNRLQANVRDFLVRLLNAEKSMAAGVALMSEITQIARENAIESDTVPWFLPLLNWVGEPHDFYVHSANVALYATAFATGLGLPDVEQVAIAGILHDIGLANIPVEIQKKPFAELSGAERNLYQRHPELSATILKNRKLGLNPSVVKMILQHHECFDGSGYPSNSAGTEISESAQVLALADWIDEEIAVKPGSALKTPVSALESLRDEILAGSRKRIDPELLNRIIEFFPRET